MRFHHYDNLRVFALVARHSSYSSAANELGLTKGAVSHQIKQLESGLGFKVFERHARGISLSQKGQELLAFTQPLYENLEQKIFDIRNAHSRALTIGVTSYFASRWLSPRLMDFMRAHPDIRLRIQPMIDVLDMKEQGIDLSIRWGMGEWKDAETERLFACPAWPTGNLEAWQKVQNSSLDSAFNEFTLLRDRDDSRAWSQWYQEAGLEYLSRTDTLIIPDPNVRVQAVIDGQGVALNDTLVETEIAAGNLFRLSPIKLSKYGYFLAYHTGAMANPDVVAFAHWIKQANSR